MQQHHDMQFLLDTDLLCRLVKHNLMPYLLASSQEHTHTHTHTHLCSTPGTAHKQVCEVAGSQGKLVSDLLLHKLPEWG